LEKDVSETDRYGRLLRLNWAVMGQGYLMTVMLRDSYIIALITQLLYLRWGLNKHEEGL
jgi:hypothetical protein